MKKLYNIFGIIFIFSLFTLSIFFSYDGYIEVYNRRYVKDTYFCQNISNSSLKEIALFQDGTGYFFIKDGKLKTIPFNIQWKYINDNKEIEITYISRGNNRQKFKTIYNYKEGIGITNKVGSAFFNVCKKGVYSQKDFKKLKTQKWNQ